jgi:hypothetical protein
MDRLMLTLDLLHAMNLPQSTLFLLDLGYATDPQSMAKHISFVVNSKLN